MPQGLWVLDGLLVIGTPVAVVVLLRRRWPVWLAYAAPVAGLLVYANIAFRFVPDAPSYYFLVSVTAVLDSMVSWHCTEYNGHTQQEMNSMVLYYPVVALLVVPTLLLLVAKTLTGLWHRARHTLPRHSTSGRA